MISFVIATGSIQSQGFDRRCKHRTEYIIQAGAMSLV